MTSDEKEFEKESSGSKSQNVNKAFEKIVRALYRRDHSITELRTKLNPYYEKETIEEAIKKADEYNYLKPEDELSKQFARYLHQKNKGHHKIRFELQKKGLPEVEMNPDLELDKARYLLEKLLPQDEASIKANYMRLKQKAQRHLQAKGFDFETIRLALNERFL